MKGGISIDTDSEPLGYFDAVVVEVETFLLLFRLALAILCNITETEGNKGSVSKTTYLVSSLVKIACEHPLT